MHLRVTDRDLWGHMTSSLQMQIQHYSRTKEETEYFIKQPQRNNRTNKHRKANVSLVNIAGRDFTRVAASALHIVKLKHLRIAIILCRNFRNIVFISQGTVTETQLLSLLFYLHSEPKPDALLSVCRMSDWRQSSSVGVARTIWLNHIPADSKGTFHISVGGQLPLHCFTVHDAIAANAEYFLFHWCKKVYWSKLSN